MIVIDANCIVKLALEEPYSQEVRELIRNALTGEEEIITVDIALAEALNAVWKHNVAIKDLPDQKAEKASSEIMEFWGNLDNIPSSLIAERAMRISKRYRLTLYDSLYIAAAIEREAKLLTLDGAMKENADRLGVELIKL